MAGEESSLARLASWGGLVVLTFALVASVLVDRAANPPIQRPERPHFAEKSPFATLRPS